VVSALYQLSFAYSNFEPGSDFSKTFDVPMARCWTGSAAIFKPFSRGYNGGVILAQIAPEMAVRAPERRAGSMILTTLPPGGRRHLAER
jgi:hypothetical protein